jgi:uncharacterized membrane protein
MTATPASLKGHPIHPMLVPIPIGLWIFSLVSDLLYRFGMGDAWATVALFTLGGGIVGALLAAIAGVIDLVSLRDPKVKKLAITHMVLNLLAVAVFGASFLLRLGGPAAGGPPFWLSVAGVVLIGVSGWLGGEMVYVRGVGVEAVQPPSPRP